MSVQVLGVDLECMTHLSNSRNLYQRLARRDDGNYTLRTADVDAQVIKTERVAFLEDAANGVVYEIRSTVLDEDIYPVLLFFVVTTITATGETEILDKMRMARKVQDHDMVETFLRSLPSVKLRLFDC
jgi:hypothetical protein